MRVIKGIQNGFPCRVASSTHAGCCETFGKCRGGASEPVLFYRKDGLMINWDRSCLNRVSSLLSPSSSITFYFAGDNNPWEVIRTTKTDYEANFCHPSVALQVLQFGTKKSLKTLNYLEMTFPSLIHLKFPGKRCLLPPLPIPFPLDLISQH